MKKIRRIITAALAVAALTASVSVTANAVTPRNQVTNGICAFEWSAGKAKVTNITTIKRTAYASVTVFDDVTGDQVAYDFDTNGISYNGSVSVSVSGYSSSNYNFKCSGGIYNTVDTSSGLAWSGTYIVN